MGASGKNSAMKALAPFWLSRKLRPTNVTRPENSSDALSSRGASDLHGMHHDAHTLTIIGLSEAASKAATDSGVAGGNSSMCEKSTFVPPQGSENDQEGECEGESPHRADGRNVSGLVLRLSDLDAIPQWPVEHRPIE